MGCNGAVDRETGTGTRMDIEGDGAYRLRRRRRSGWRVSR